jgi:hypothetical protein
MDGKNNSGARERREFNVDMNVWLSYNKLHVNRTYIFIVFVPQHVSVQFTPSLGVVVIFIVKTQTPHDSL